MRKFSEPEILALAAKWRARARKFMREASDADDRSRMSSLVGMASSMKHAADDLLFEAGIDPNVLPLPVNPLVDREQRAADERLNPGPKERQP
jgi:hypothetical protein